MFTLLIVENDASSYRREIEKRRLPQLNILSSRTISEAALLIGQADIILGRPDFTAPLLSQASRLKWMQSTYAGIESLCVEGLRSDYILTGVKDIFGPLMSEYVFAYILAQERSLFKTRENQSGRIWAPIPYHPLNQSIIGIAGLGSIGRHIAATANHFSMHVVGLKRTPGIVPHVNRIYLETEKSQFLSLLDYLVITLPQTRQTKHFIELNDLKLMKPSSILISVGRGSVINQQGLTTALQKKYIAGAVLDVFEQEPLPPESPLWGMSNVIITPHNSAQSFPDQVVSLFSENYELFLTQKELKHVVDFTTGY